MQNIYETIRQQDEAAEYQMRLDLRAALAAALEYITSNDHQARAALIETIRQTLEETAP